MKNFEVTIGDIDGPDEDVWFIDFLFNQDNMCLVELINADGLVIEWANYWEPDGGFTKYWLIDHAVEHFGNHIR